MLWKAAACAIEIKGWLIIHCCKINNFHQFYITLRYFIQQSKMAVKNSFGLVFSGGCEA